MTQRHPSRADASIQDLQVNRRGLLRAAGMGASSLAFFGVSGCFDQPAKQKVQKQGGERAETVVFDLAADRITAPDVWNPLSPTCLTLAGLQQCVIEPLFILNYETGKTEPWLGLKMEPNARFDSWRLTLREGITWSDGKPFSADDVVFTLTMLKDSAPEPMWSGDMAQWVKQVTRVGDTEVDIQLTQPNPRFQTDYFSVKIYWSVPILPAHIWKGQDPVKFTNFDLDKGWPVFTGPYRLAKASESRAEYARNDDWWGAKAGFLPLPQPKKLVWVWTPTEEIAVGKAEHGDIDSVDNTSRGSFETLKAKNPNFIAWTDKPPYSWQDPAPRMLALNHQKEPWGDKDVRWAVNHAIDRKKIIEIAYEGSSTPATNVFPEYASMRPFLDPLKQSGLTDRYPVAATDPARTAQILGAKGYQKNDKGIFEKGGKPLEMMILVDQASIEIQRIAQILVEQLQAAGIDAKQRVTAGSALNNAITTGTYDAAIVNPSGSVNEPWSSLRHYHSKYAAAPGKSIPNTEDGLVRWRNQAFSDLLDQMSVLSADDPKMVDLFLKAEEIFLAELPILPLAQAARLQPFDTTYWTNWPSAENPYVQPTVWWGNTHKIIHSLKKA